MKTIIAEKPSVAKEIAHIVGADKREEGYMQGNGYYVYTFDTRLADCYYKGTFWKANKQMTLFRAETNFNQESYADDWNLPSKKNVLIANVFTIKAIDPYGHIYTASSSDVITNPLPTSHTTTRANTKKLRSRRNGLRKDSLETKKEDHANAIQ